MPLLEGGGAGAVARERAAVKETGGRGEKKVLGNAAAEETGRRGEKKVLGNAAVVLEICCRGIRAVIPVAIEVDGDVEMVEVGVKRVPSAGLWRSAHHCARITNSARAATDPRPF